MRTSVKLVKINGFKLVPNKRTHLGLWKSSTITEVTGGSVENPGVFSEAPIMCLRGRGLDPGGEVGSDDSLLEANEFGISDLVGRFAIESLESTGDRLVEAIGAPVVRGVCFTWFAADPTNERGKNDIW